MSMSAIRQAGVSLIELIVFITVVAILVVGLFKALARTLPTDPVPQEITQATQLAQERMELILGQKDNLGFANIGINIGDPCVGGSPPGICVTAGFTVTVTGDSSTVACPALIDGSTANCRSITVTVNDSATNRQLATLTSLVTNF